MINLKDLENEIKYTNAKIDFYLKSIKEAQILGIENLIDYTNYLKISAVNPQ
jgi:hypothetical protein